MGEFDKLAGGYRIGINCYKVLNEKKRGRVNRRKYRLRWSFNPRNGGIVSEHASDADARNAADYFLRFQATHNAVHRNDLLVENLDTKEVWVRRVKRAGLFKFYWEDWELK
jgi:hypothetical protein